MLILIELFYTYIFSEKNWNTKFVFKLFNYITEGKRPYRPELIPDVYWELIQKCWCQNPEDRLTFEDITNMLRSDKYTLEELGMKTNLDQQHGYQNRIDTD